MKILTAAQMRDVDRRAIKGRGVPGHVLMENAGESVADLIRRVIAEPAGASVIVFAGKGNNGGDGHVAARHLAQWGIAVRIVLAGTIGDVGGDAAHHLQLAREAGAPVEEITTSLALWRGREALIAAAQESEILVDALLGTGVKGEVTGVVGELIELINAVRAKRGPLDSALSLPRGHRGGRPLVVAVDIPSGINSDTGEVCGRAVEADYTVTMGLPKLGLMVGEGIAHSGRVSVADLGYPADLVAQSDCAAELVEREWADSVMPARRLDANKGDFGRLAVIAGSVGMTGAAALCSMAALRMGAGLVTLGIPASLNDIMEVKVTEVMTLPLPETRERTLSLDARDAALAFAHERDVVVMGPGLSRHPQTKALVADLVAAIERPLVLDADGINALEGDPSPLRARSAPTILTPHPGEMARLIGKTAAEVQRDRLAIARRAAAHFGCIVVLKGARTIIADSQGRAYINSTGNPGMASGGMGDVLSGMIGALLAQLAAGTGTDQVRVPSDAAFRAAAAAVFFHGLAGDLAAAEKTEPCLIAGDLLDYLPPALKRPQ
jgi:NAD(P)H-hydrate epimerase